jgi:small-conductance mechanosensitive channel
MFFFYQSPKSCPSKQRRRFPFSPTFVNNIASVRQRLFRAVWPGLILLLPLLIVALTVSPAIAQLPPLVPSNSNSLPAGVEQQGTLESAPVRLDGTTLFRIASPAVVNRSDPGYLVPVEVRASQIEGNLQWLLPVTWSGETTLPPNNLEVVVKTVNGFPVLYAESPALPQPRVLLTVTDADAQYYAVGKDELAAQWRDELEQKLRQAVAKRQPEAVRRRLHIFFAVIIGTVSITLVIGLIWRTLGQREKKLRQQREIQLQAQQDEAARNQDGEASPTFNGIDRFLRLQQQLQFVRFLRWLNFWVIAFTWAAGMAYALRLFPQTRLLARKLIIAPMVLLMVWFIVGLINRLIDFSIDKLIQQLTDSQDLTNANLQRVGTITRVVKGIKMVLVYTVGVLLVLQWLELVPGSVLALGTLLALVISFAAQNLIRDLVNGFMILLEDQYRIGDVVNIGDKGGLVENFNLRITQLRSPDGHLITLPNNSIVEVENLSRDWARSDFRIEVAYDTNVDLALAIVRETAEAMARDPDWRSTILATDEFFGIERLSHEGIVIRIWVKTLPIQQWAVAMELRRRLKIAFDSHDIRIGIPQQLWMQPGNHNSRPADSVGVNEAVD